jgi:hypothetical protein
LFHCLARCAADSLIGGQGATRSKHAWRQVYRALEHSAVSEACRKQTVIKKFPQHIEDFANLFVAMQAKRHLADYDPYGKFTKSVVNGDIATIEKVIRQFMRVPLKDRQAFSAYVLFKPRKE